MKKIITPGQREEVEFLCDACGKESFGQLQLHFWYGSNFDMTQATVHLCDECALKTMTHLKENLKINLELKEIIEL